MNAPSIDIKDILAGTSSLALTFGTDLFVSQMPDTPDQCVAVYDTGGYDQDADISYERPTVQVRVRGTKGGYVNAYSLTQNIRDTLHALANYTINGARYIAIWCQGDILSLGYDDNHRPLLSVNFLIHRTEA
jgi:hypothetical protein